MDNINTKDEIIVLGDLNARIGNDVIPGVKQKYNEAIINENGEALIDFCVRNEVRINNTYFPHKDQHKYTFNNNRGQRSMIDFILTNRVITQAQVVDVRALTSANLGTDHNLVLGKILLKCPQQKRKHPQFIEKYNLESLTTESTKLLYKSRVTNKLKEIDLKPEWGVEENWQSTAKCIKEAAEEAIGKRKINVNATNHTKPWFCQEVKELSESKRKCYLTYKSAPLE
ncbi:craniofacial development protein 2-like [Diorhabda carinulata]|uniref:craniofacial development protein 2-like n=1 Tax=Diorhabda carinulata TaxID=1163345 RepID=UPI0025A041FF|nr:craniofacial development protein 2-like [Diorhabda carinulata]